MPIAIGRAAHRPHRLVHLSRDPLAHLAHETVERKGVGHPDSLADALALELSRAWARFTLRECEGVVLHHQFDKLVIVGGRTEVSWGGGRFVEPIRVLLLGRVSRSFRGRPLPVTELLEGETRAFFRARFPMLDLGKDLVVEDQLTSSPGPGTLLESTGAIAQMFAPSAREVVRGYEALVANDTSAGVGRAPLTALESAVLSLERWLTGPARQRRPWLGTDVKVMAHRLGEDVELTVCVPQVAAYVPSLAAYRANLEVIGAAMLDRLAPWFDPARVQLSLNTKDDEATSNHYLTVTGASLSGDLGAVGRGNRVDGLTSFTRPMSLEGFAGKNPRYYAGFVYSVLSQELANAVHTAQGDTAEVEIISQNGAPLGAPWRITVTSLAPVDEVTRLVEGALAQVERVTARFLEGKLPQPVLTPGTRG
ncbi:MAG: methionine adenosyltransferase [Myxococcota bacterium]